VISWLLILGSLPAILTILRARRVDHVIFFSAGYLYYWVLPIFVGQFPFQGAENNFAYQHWLGIFDSLPRSQLMLYAISIFTYYLCFRLGDSFARRTVRKGESRKTSSLHFVPLLYVFVFILAVGYAFHIRAGIGMNYGDLGDELFTAKGTLTAISLVLLALSLLLTTAKEKANFISTVANRWILGYFVIAFILLAMGERLYVMTSLLLLIAYRSIFFKKYTAIQLFSFVIGIAVLSALMGLVRMRTNLNINALILNLAFEPVFTGYSLLSFLANNHIPWIGLPKFLAGDFLNLVPSAVWEHKADFLIDPVKSGFYFEMPLGAINSWVSLIVNFGLVGTAFAMIFMGYFLRWLRRKASSPIIRTQYLMCSAFMVFTVFRDPFSVSIVKNIVEFSLLAPLLCAFASRVLVWSASATEVDLPAGMRPETHL
jgi:hypothetical protein